MRELVKIAQATPACLVCFEADYSTCHRTYVARAAHQLGGPTVVHLTAKTALPDLGYQQAACHSCLTFVAKMGSGASPDLGHPS